MAPTAHAPQLAPHAAATASSHAGGRTRTPRRSRPSSRRAPAPAASPAAAVDLAERRLPDALTLPALPAALLLVAPLGGEVVARAAAGAGVAVVAHAALHLVAPPAMGAGDVKLAGPLGAVLAAASWAALALAAVSSAASTAAVAVAGRCAGWVARGAAVPHGPSMLLVAWLVATGSAVSGAAG